MPSSLHLGFLRGSCSGRGARLALDDGLCVKNNQLFMEVAAHLCFLVFSVSVDKYAMEQIPERGVPKSKNSCTLSSGDTTKALRSSSLLPSAEVKGFLFLPHSRESTGCGQPEGCTISGSSVLLALRGNLNSLSCTLAADCNFLPCDMAVHIFDIAQSCSWASCREDRHREWALSGIGESYKGLQGS